MLSCTEFEKYISDLFVKDFYNYKKDIGIVIGEDLSKLLYKEYVKFPDINIIKDLIIESIIDVITRQQYKNIYRISDFPQNYMKKEFIINGCSLKFDKLQPAIRDVLSYKYYAIATNYYDITKISQIDLYKKPSTKKIITKKSKELITSCNKTVHQSETIEEYIITPYYYFEDNIEVIKETTTIITKETKIEYSSLNNTNLSCKITTTNFYCSDKSNKFDGNIYYNYIKDDMIINNNISNQMFNTNNIINIKTINTKLDTENNVETTLESEVVSNNVETTSKSEEVLTNNTYKTDKKLDVNSEDGKLQYHKQLFKHIIINNTYKLLFDVLYL